MRRKVTAEMADSDGKTGGDPQGNNNDQATFESFEAFLEKQPEDVKKLYESHTTGLRNALNSERSSNKDLSNQLKKLAEKADKGSELEKQLSEYASKYEQAERRATFAEDAIKPEIGCTNVKAAFAIAQADDLFRRDGSPDWDGIKKAAPELFQKAGSGAPGKAGAGTDKPPAKEDMNAIIRRAAGRA